MAEAARRVWAVYTHWVRNGIHLAVGHECNAAGDTST